MPRPRKRRRLRFAPEIFYFKPRGIPLRKLEEIVLHRDEIEALKLHDVEGLGQVEAAAQMEISQPTFARILNKTYKKLAEAIIKGKAIKVEK